MCERVCVGERVCAVKENETLCVPFAVGFHNIHVDCETERERPEVDDRYLYLDRKREKYNTMDPL